MQNNSRTSLFGFIVKNKITLVLIVILIALIKQNILDNDFPNVITKKQKDIDEIEITNLNLLNDNALLENQISGYILKRYTHYNCIQDKPTYRHTDRPTDVHYKPCSHIV